MKNITFILLCIFYIAAMLIGYIPNIPNYDTFYFTYTQILWVFIFIICYCLSVFPNTKQQTIVIRSLILLGVFELIDEYFELNSYLPMTIKRVLKLDAIVCIAVTLFTIYKLYKSWQKEKLQTL